jgi:hypothetical protein
MAGVVHNISDHDQHPVYSNNVDPGIIIYFPDLTKGNNEDDDRTWEEVCLLAAETHRPRPYQVIRLYHYPATTSTFDYSRA